MADGVTQFEMLVGPLWDGDGTQIDTPYAKFFVAGTSTPKNAYADIDKAVSFTKKALSAEGNTVYGDGIYKVSVYEGDPDDPVSPGPLVLEVDNYRCEGPTADPQVYVEDFGAVGDNDQGKATANLTAIQAAVDYVNNQAPGGGEVRFKAGKYWINGKITLPESVSLAGEGSRWFGATQLSTTDNTTDILELGGYNRISNISLGSISKSGATNRGIYINATDHNYLTNVHIEAVGTGIDVYSAIWNSFDHVDVYLTAVQGLKMSGNTSTDTYSNNNVFTGCKFRTGDGKGIVINRGTGNSFVGCNIENNTGIGIEIDGLFAGAFLPTSQVPTTIGGHSFVSCWIEANGTAGESAIKIRDDADTEFIGCNIYSTNTVDKTARTTGVVDIDYARRIKFSGKINDFADTKKHFYLGAMAFGTDISRMDTYDMSAVTDLGINTVYAEDLFPADPERLIANASFNVLGGGGADVFGSWTETNNTAGTGAISADNTDLLRPQTHSQYSCKFTMEASPASVMSILQTATLAIDTTYYAVIEYRNGTTDKINSPLDITIYDNTNAKFWDFVNQTWDASTKTLDLPISGKPTHIAVPFTTVGTSTSYRLQVRNSATGADAANVIHWIYSATFQTTKTPSPPTDWTAAPSANTWKVGDRVVRIPPVVGQPKAWSCTVAGTPGTWVSEGNL